MKGNQDFKLDEKDLLLLRQLESDSNLTAKKLAFLLGMPQTTIHNRIRRLKKLGVIRKYVAVLDYRKMGSPITAYVLLDIDYMVHDVIFKKLSGLPFISEASAVTGSNDIVLKIRARDAEELGNIVLRNLRRLGGVTRTETLLVLEAME